MPRRKDDIEIGKRAQEEVYRVYGNREKATRIMRLSKNVIYEWGQGSTPGGRHLAVLHYHGCDVMYILTGKRYSITKEG